MLVSTIVSIILLVNQFHQPQIASPEVLAQRAISLEKRQNDKWVNSVFKENILLTIAYADDQVQETIDWNAVTKPSNYEIVLQPDQVFAFHDSVLPIYKDKSIITTNAHFNYDDGFKSDGYLMGDGVCHLASLMNWVARDAGLLVESPVDHNFAAIPEVPKEFGTSIYFMPGDSNRSARQNLYITNTLPYPVALRFEFDGEMLNFAIIAKTPEKPLLGFNK